MDYEKKYKEALKDMRAIYPNLKGDAKLAVEHAFPELRESENERIRKGLIELIENWNYPQELFTTKQNIIAYLEKQKEPIDPFDTKLFQDGVKEGRRLEREDMEKEQKPAEWSEDKFPKDIEKDATQFCFDKGFNITPYQAKEIATHYLMIGHNFGYVEGRKNAHIPAKELGLPSSMDFKQEWSEEDEKVLKTTIAVIERNIKKGSQIATTATPSGYINREDLIKKLKSLRPHWKPSEEQPQVADASKMEQSEDYLEYWLEHFGMPKENIENCADQIAQGYGASRYLEGVQAGAEAVNELGKQEKGYDEAYLDECIAKARKTWEGVDADKYMDEVRGREQVQPEVELEKASRNVYESWKGGTMDDFLRDMVELGKALNARKEK